MSGKPLHCAIYTRKSTDEGLEQPFNSLHAQRLACEAYIRSQAGEGWVISANAYDDGGFSGGDLRRPALQRLLHDLEAGLVDAVVVYKVDRLTRSLGDFARLVEVFDRARASFVSVTQAFNTTNSMGRLTLNILLSFAQFEREITGERIRDKIRASKALGLWMGGAVPIGYMVAEGSRAVLAVSESDARTVRIIFQKFLELGNTHRLQEWLTQEGIRSKRRVTRAGKLVGGHIFSRGALKHLLRNRIYIGEIVHKGTSHPGRHPAIVDRATFDATQTLLDDLSRRHRGRITRAHRTLLNGLMFDADGAPMKPIFSRRNSGGTNYAYYASVAPPGDGAGDRRDGAIRRVPTYLVDSFIRTWAARLTNMSLDEVGSRKIRSLVARLEVHPSSVIIVVPAKSLSQISRRRDALDAARATLAPGEEARRDPNDANRIRVTMPVRLVARGGRTWPTPPQGHATGIVGRPDPKLVRDLRAGHAVLRRCNVELDGFDRTLLRKASAPKGGRDRRLSRLAFLAPEIQRAILAGAPLRYPVGEVPLSWPEQRRLFGLTHDPAPHGATP